MAKTLGELKNEDILDSNDVMERIAEIEDALDADYPRDPDLADERAKAEAELATLQAFARLRATYRELFGPVCERCFSATEWRTCPECGCEHMCDVCGYCPTCADEQAAGQALWVVAYEYGTQEAGGGSGFDWFPNESLDKAISAYECLEVGFEGTPLARYFIEYYPSTAYSIAANIRSRITQEIEAEIWSVLPDDRPTI